MSPHCHTSPLAYKRPSYNFQKLKKQEGLDIMDKERKLNLSVATKGIPKICTQFFLCESYLQDYFPSPQHLLPEPWTTALRQLGQELQERSKKHD